MTPQQIKANAPDGATHYRFTIFGIPCYLSSRIDGVYYWSILKNKWVKSFSTYSDLKPL